MRDFRSCQWTHISDCALRVNVLRASIHIHIHNVRAPMRVCIHVCMMCIHTCIYIYFPFSNETRQNMTTIFLIRHAVLKFVEYIINTFGATPILEALRHTITGPRR